MCRRSLRRMIGTGTKPLLRSNTRSSAFGKCCLRSRRSFGSLAWFVCVAVVSAVISSWSPCPKIKSTARAETPQLSPHPPVVMVSQYTDQRQSNTVNWRAIHDLTHNPFGPNRYGGRLGWFHPGTRSEVRRVVGEG